MKPRERLLLIAVAAGLCGVVFVSYLQPALIVDLGNRLWACF